MICRSKATATVVRRRSHLQRECRALERVSIGPATGLESALRYAEATGCQRLHAMAGLALQGWELKAIRAGRANITEAYAIVRHGEIFLFGAQITPLN